MEGYLILVYKSFSLFGYDLFKSKKSQSDLTPRLLLTFSAIQAIVMR